MNAFLVICFLKKFGTASDLAEALWVTGKITSLAITLLSFVYICSCYCLQEGNRPKTVRKFFEMAGIV
jgi:hypothetical protein